MSTIASRSPLNYLNISETVKRYRGLVPNAHNRKLPPPVNQMVTWPMTSRDSKRANSWPEYV